MTDEEPGLLEELKRRKVARVAIDYVMAAWIALLLPRPACSKRYREMAHLMFNGTTTRNFAASQNGGRNTEDC